MKSNLIILCILFVNANIIRAQNGISGKIVDEQGLPIAGATITLEDTNVVTHSGEDGTFLMQGNQGSVLLVSYIGYQTKEITMTEDVRFPLQIQLLEKMNQLKEVNVSSGYQTLSKERSTGSFAQVDNDLLNRRVSIDVLSRIEDVIPGVIFNRSGPSNDPISIRGRNTIFANAKPLIILDNFPYEGDLMNLNPNDVESVTVLKDAAASSIWGARAGNGVIVITTKKGKYNTSAHLSFNSNVTIGEKTDQFYLSRLSSADFIDLEKMLFSQGFYQNAEQSANHMPLTPVVELLIAKRDGMLEAAEADRQIEALKKLDVRNDFDHYFNRKNVHQQYALNLNGGHENYKYRLSVGYDKSLDNLVGNDYSRLTFNGNNTYAFFKQRLEVSTGIYLTSGISRNNNPGTNSIIMKSGYLYPYAQLADENGTPLQIAKDYRLGFVEDAESKGLLNWQYRPLEEIGLADNTTKSIDYRLNAMVNYKILPSLGAEVLYQYGISDGVQDNLRSQQSYYTRDLINNFSQVTATDIKYIIPLGGILDRTNSTARSYNYRGQLNFNESFGTVHDINAIAGFEVMELKTVNNASRLYGYDDEHVISRPVDYVNFHPQYSYPGAVSRIQYLNDGRELIDRFRSYYLNASYTYKQRYTFSGSGRIDQSNLFGVKTNQKGIPLWSAGLSWEVSREDFFNINCLPYLRARLTYGYSGNVDKTVSAYSTALYLNNAFNTGLPYAQIRTSSNPELRWERITIFNLGLDFSLKENRMAGSIEYYNKEGIDLMGNMAFAPSTGITSFKGNFANTVVNGLDLTLHAKVLDTQTKWGINILFSANKDKVTQYFQEASGVSYLYYSGTPLTDRPLYALYSYKWGGLDPENGDPIGFLNGAESKNYSSIRSSASPENLIYNGSARPTMFGAVRNTVSWKNFSLSANISYRLGYYFRKPSVTYASILNGAGGHGDYALRWKKPGDEVFTSVPSMPSQTSTARDNFYYYSEILVKKGDHIRFQDFNLSYSFSKKNFNNLPVNRCQVYLYVNNLGILWKSEKGDIDPDYYASVPPGRTVALGLKVDL